MLRNRLREREQDNGVVLAFISVHARIASSSSMALTQSCRPTDDHDYGRDNHSFRHHAAQAEGTAICRIG